MLKSTVIVTVDYKEKLLDRFGEPVSVVRCINCGETFCIRDQDIVRIGKEIVANGDTVLSWIDGLNLCCERPSFASVSSPRIDLFG